MPKLKKEDKNSRFPIILFFILLVLLVNTARSIKQLKGGSLRLEEISAKLDQEKAKNEDLKKQLEYAKSPEYLEKMAVERLNITKPGYKILIINENSPEQISSSQPKQEQKTYTNWQLWLQTFGILKN